MERAHARSLLGLLVASLALALASELALGSVLGWEPSTVRTAIEVTGALAPIAYVGLVIAAIVVPPLPSVPLDIAAGALFGVAWGTVLTLLGDLVGASVAFLLARRLGRPWLARRVASGARGHVATLDALASGLTPRRLAGVRLLPTFSFEMVSYAAGLSSMSLGAFVVATLVGVTGPVVLLVGLGDALVTHRAEALAVLGALLVLTATPLAWWSWRPRRDDPRAP